MQTYKEMTVICPSVNSRILLLSILYDRMINFLVIIVVTSYCGKYEQNPLLDQTGFQTCDVTSVSDVRTGDLSKQGHSKPIRGQQITRATNCC